MAFSDDQAWFEANRAFVAQQYNGQFVIVKDGAVLGAYPDYASAVQAANAMFGAQAVLIKQALPQEPVRIN